MKILLRLRAAAAILAAALALGAAAGCQGVDEPAPRLPIGDRLVGLSSPDSALYSLILGLEREAPDHYAHALAESANALDADFHAAFDPLDTAQFRLDMGRAAPTDWTSRDERTFFAYFVALRPAGYAAAFFPDTSRADMIGPHEAVLHRRYRIHAGTENLATGLADLTLRRVGVYRNWKIVGWVDRRDTSDVTVRTYGWRRLESLLP